MFSDIKKPLGLVAAAFGMRLKEQGPTPKGVLWNSTEGQELRFELLLELLGDDINTNGLIINDLGCGYGALFSLLRDMPPLAGGRYWGIDICKEMIEAANQQVNDPRASFYVGQTPTQQADYSFASGTYNMKGTAPDEEWGQHTKENLTKLWDKSTKGMAFNLLNSKRKKYREEWLYYPDAEEYLDFCLTNLSLKTKIVDSTSLDEWTFLVRR